jgi:hypothetical protein
MREKGKGLAEKFHSLENFEQVAQDDPHVSVGGLLGTGLF